jgi:toxin CcdB
VAHQFDIVENLNPVSRNRYPFLVVLQHDRTASLNSVIVAPVTASSLAMAASRLHPAVEIGDEKYVLLVEELAGVRDRAIGSIVGSAEGKRYAIVAALDLLFTGV